ncbi:MAG: hypothetical protein BWX88_00173 [Planctomycetes bacterium ADurb.Bin126]|nr:MAG: hypothetical protein BWX88_00173 [Planctomycetes bacterium ADurb.Bin126]HOD84412.1 type II secretion system protein [Phycisphaerae bacterium]HQL73029.1 type II secretion system protein [Phycisphaerae bacterium]
MRPELTLPAPRRTAGFSLVELLVVIAIIAILLAVMAPSARSIQRLTQMNVCKNNLHAIGRAAAQYAAENDCHVPRDAWDTSQPGHYLFAGCFMKYTHNIPLTPAQTQTWSEMYKVLKGAAPIYRCPSVTDLDHVLTYVINAVNFETFMTGGGYQSPLPVRLTHLPDSPGAIGYIVEGNEKLLPVSYFGYHDVWHTSHMTFVGTTPQTSPRSIHADDMRHEGKTTVVFFDGHCEDRNLTPHDFPVTLFNPLHTAYAPN